MKKFILAVLILMMSMLAMSSLTKQAHANINQWRWLEPTFTGTDSFYNAFVTAYTEGTTAKVSVLVDRDGAPVITQVNITAVSVVFDWGGNYTLVASPVYVLDATIPQAAFTVSFTVPSTATASNMFLHAFSIYVKYVTSSGSGTFPVAGGDSFAVYSATQADAQALKQTASSYSLPSGGFSSVEARILWEQGDAEVTKGDTSYMLGNFAGARAYYQSAINDYAQAYAAETAYSQDYRESQTNQNNAYSNYYNAYASYSNKTAEAAVTSANADTIQANAAVTQADAASKQADAALTNAYGWMAIGIGWILIGVGAIVYGLRRPKIAAA